MKRKYQMVLAACGIALATSAAAEITFYEGEGFRGRAFTTQDRVRNFERMGFNDRASSVVVGEGRWEVCEHARFEGRCVVLRRGSYPSLRQVGLHNAISSARQVEPGRVHRYDDAPPVVTAPPGRAYGPPPAVTVPPGRAYGHPPPPVPAPYPQEVRPAFYEVPVTSVRAVMGPPNQRCWIEREQVAQPHRGEPNIGGAVVGGIIGGVLGHQIGGGSGKDLATAGGAIAGAAIGANVNRNSGTAYVERDVQRCQTVSNAQPAYWDVTYFHRGVEHRAQMTSAPGVTLRVNADGAPLMTAR